MRPYARISRFALASGTLALVAATPSASVSAHPHEVPPPDEESPVNCSMFDHREDDMRLMANATAGVPSPAYMSPPPAVMAPPPAMRTAASGPVASEPAPMPRPPVIGIPINQRDRERYNGEEVASIFRAAEVPVSTFSIDVDTGSYTNSRRMLNEGRLPQSAAVRTEEFINYFRYDYPKPSDATAPFSVSVDSAASPWNEKAKLLRVGLRGYDVDSDDRPAANLVFLVDVSGSMNSSNKLPLVKKTLTLLVDQLRADDTVSIVVYSGTVGTLLKPTNDKRYVKQAVDCLYARGSTAGGAALDLAYKVARDNYDKNKINRILLATDGDFNVGVSNNDAIVDKVERERESGVTLTTLGYGTGNYNEAMMERIADAGNGNYAYIDNAMEAKKVLSDQLAATLYTIAKDVKIQVEFNPAYVSEYRLVGYENRLLAEEDFDNDAVDAGDIGAGHQVTALYEVIPAGTKGWLPQRRYTERPAGEGSKNGEMAFIKLRYKLPGQDNSRLIEKPLSSRLLKAKDAPKGDFAFISAVAAFGQWLRGDKYLGGYTVDQISDLASRSGAVDNAYRKEFLSMLAKAKGMRATTNTPRSSDPE